MCVEWIYGEEKATIKNLKITYGHENKPFAFIWTSIVSFLKKRGKRKRIKRFSRSSGTSHGVFGASSQCFFKPLPQKGDDKQSSKKGWGGAGGYSQDSIYFRKFLHLNQYHIPNSYSTSEQFITSWSEFFLQFHVWLENYFSRNIFFDRI